MNALPLWPASGKTFHGTFQPVSTARTPQSLVGGSFALTLSLGPEHVRGRPVLQRGRGAAEAFLAKRWFVAKLQFVGTGFAMLLSAVLAFFDLQLTRLRRRRRPRRIILVRHGESLGNVDSKLYETVADSTVPLTALGFNQGKAAGKEIRELIGDESVSFFYSPYMRTRQTLLAILEAFHGVSVNLTSEPRLREQDFGNFQNSERMKEVMKERQRFGRFYYRFLNGEAGTDVYDRVAEFWSTLFRCMDRPGGCEQNVVLVTHGLLMRIFCMHYLRWTVLEFEQVWNPSNCEIWVLERAKFGRYRLVGRRENKKWSPIKFGVDQAQPLHEHMKEPCSARNMVPGSGDEMLDVSLAHLRVPFVETSSAYVKNTTEEISCAVGTATASCPLPPELLDATDQS